MRRNLMIGTCVVALMLTGVAVADGQQPAETPPQLVAAYDSLADVILGAKQTEWNLVHSILAMTYSHAEGTYAKAKKKIEAGKDAGADIELLAELVSQLANEGDAAVGAVRKRLLEGGHHHNAAGEAQGIYEEGFVIVTRKAKKALLESAQAIGRSGRAPDAAQLAEVWAQVQDQFEKLHEGVDMER